jgi:hypothetical protein
LILGACSRPENPGPSPTPATSAPAATPAPPAAPIAVHVALPANPEPAVAAWAEILATAITSGQGGLTLAATPEEALAVVRIDTVEDGTDVDPEPDGEGELHVMRGALVVGSSARAFNLVYRGDARPQAEALARNLRRLAAEGATVATGETPDAAREPATEPEAADAEDEG